jgi:hypothetical protein
MFCTLNPLETMCQAEFWPELYNLVTLTLKKGYWNVLPSSAKRGL